MTNTIKRTITLVLTIAMFAIMSTNTFAASSETIETVAERIGQTLWESKEYGYLGLNAPINTFSASTAHTAVSFRLDGVVVRHTFTPHCGLPSAMAVGIVPCDFKEMTSNDKVLRMLDAVPRTNGLFTTPIVKDYYDTQRKITREEFAIILANAAKYGGYTGDNLTTVFADADKFSTADGKSAAQFCIDNGLLHYEGHYETFIDYASITPEMIAAATDGMGRVFLDYYEQERWIENTDGKFNPQGTVDSDELNEACAKLREILNNITVSQEIANREASIKANQALVTEAGYETEKDRANGIHCYDTPYKN